MFNFSNCSKQIQISNIFIIKNFSNRQIHENKQAKPINTFPTKNSKISFINLHKKKQASNLIIKDKDLTAKKHKFNKSKKHQSFLNRISMCVKLSNSNLFPTYRNIGKDIIDF